MAHNVSNTIIYSCEAQFDACRAHLGFKFKPGLLSIVWRTFPFVVIYDATVNISHFALRSSNGIYLFLFHYSYIICV